MITHTQFAKKMSSQLTRQGPLITDKPICTTDVLLCVSECREAVHPQKSPTWGAGTCPETLAKSRTGPGKKHHRPPWNGKNGNYPSSEWGPGGNTSAQVPQHPDHDDARLQPVGPGLESGTKPHRGSPSARRSRRRSLRLLLCRGESRGLGPCPELGAAAGTAEAWPKS